MNRQEIYEHIDTLYENINKLKGEYIALTDDEVKCIRTNKFEFRVLNITSAIDRLAELARSIQDKRYK